MSVNIARDEVLPLLKPIEDKETEPKKFSIRKEGEIIVLMLLVIATGALNRVFVKITTEPMGKYAFLLSIFNDVAYIISYGVLLLGKMALGLVKKDSLMYPFRREVPVDPPCKGLIRRTWESFWNLKYFILIGFMEGVANIITTVCNVYVSGIMGSLASQLVLVFAMPIAVVILKTRYNYKQVLGALIVICGSLVAIVPTWFTTTNNGPIGFIILMACSGLPSSISFTIKELIFRKKSDLEIFVVNTTGSIFQLLWWPLLLVMAIAFQQTNGLPIGTYLRYGFLCFVGHNPPGDHQCGPMPVPYIIYIVNNLLFNISVLVLLKKASALQAFMATNTVLPVGFFLFLYHWPLIGAAKLTLEDIISLIVILAGIVLFRLATIYKDKK